LATGVRLDTAVHYYYLQIKSRNGY